MLTLNLLITEGSENYAGIAYPKNIFEILMNELNGKLRPIGVFERLSMEEEDEPERGDRIGTVMAARTNGKYIECDIVFDEKNKWRENTYDKNEFSLNTEIQCKCDDDSNIIPETIVLRALSITETNPKIK